MATQNTSKPNLKSKVVKVLATDVINSSLFLTFFISSILMLTVAGLFNVPGVVEHPQFSEAVDTLLVKNTIFEDVWLKFSYYTFFWLDFIWAFCLLLLIWKFVKKRFPIRNNKKRSILFAIFTAIVCLAYLFDVLENIHYMKMVERSNFFIYIKLALYTVVAAIFLISVQRYLYTEFWPTLRQFLISAFYSLLILFLIGVLLPTAPQVNSIVVDLYLDQWNMIILLLAAPIFAVAIAHYPSYFGITEENRQWSMANWKFWVFGIVSYRYNKDYSEASAGKTEGRVNFLFRVLGICFYAALFYMIAYTAEVNFNWYIKASTMAISLLACSILVLQILKIQKDNWYEKNYEYLFNNLPFFYDGDYTSKIAKESASIIENSANKKNSVSEESQQTENQESKKTFHINWGPITTYLWLLLITIVVHLALFTYIICCSECAYSELSTILSLVCILLQCITFVYYRSYRSLFRFVFFNKENNAIMNSFYKLPYGEKIDVISKTKVKVTLDEQKKMVELFFKNLSLPDSKGLVKFATILRFGSLSNNVTFLKLNTLFGLLNLVFFLILNFSLRAAVFFNGILIILSALFFFYGVLVVLTKNFIYYKHSTEPNKKKNKTKFIYTILVAFVLLIGLNRASRIWSNNLFTLSPVDRNEDKELSLQQFRKELDSTAAVRYYIGCYGGGMKSNAWTMTVLNALYNQDNDFYKKTAGISGVSGGTMGLANMSAIMAQNTDEKKWPVLIKKVATENILSIDLAHALGRDTFNHLLIPKCTLSGIDRSSKAMQRYAYLTNNSTAYDSLKSYRTYWREIYDSLPGSFPILIANSTDVKGNQGMAVSVKVNDSKAYDLLYQGAQNILEIQNRNGNKQTLTFYDAMSTSNRFPLISPAAKIETKGHFNDGGIYENSGLLSAYKLFEAINHLDTVNDVRQLKQKNIFLSIVNSKDAYIKYILKEFECKPVKINENMEINAIISSIADTEMMPIYIKHKLERLKANSNGKIGFETIYLPHRFTVADVKRLLGKELNCASKPKVDAFLHTLVQTNNKKISDLIDPSCNEKHTPIIEPPMSRVMAEPAYDFMKAMLKHTQTENAIDRILNLK